MNPLIAGLLKPDAYAHPVAAPRLIETHISWVILAGEFAYKIKKPLDFGFLDFSSLDKRHHFCEEEIRLNRRLVPDIYLGVVAISGTIEAPRMDASGPVLEWAVKMRAFPADATLDREPEITAEQIDAIAERIAAFHGQVAIAATDSAYGKPETLTEPVETNFVQLRKLLSTTGSVRAELVEAHPFDKLRASGKTEPLLDTLYAWSQAEGARLTAHFAARKANGFVRECHGDLHLGNIAWVTDGSTTNPLIFDALEFNPALRHIDVISEIAFLVMDLRHRGRTDLAWRLLNHYLDQTGDIAGLAALTYYQVYRAIVRAKVTALQASQASQANQADSDFSECLSYLELANRLAHDRRPALILMHGVSGSGKTWLSQHLLEQLGGIRLRSDVVRKRLFGLKPLQDSAAIPGGIYTAEASARSLAALIETARVLLTAGFLVIVDATFIHRSWRAPFQLLAEEISVAWQIVSVEAPTDVLQARITQRLQNGADASEANQTVLASQLANLEPFVAAEEAHVLRLGSGWTVASAISQIRSTLNP
jgi:aminoglycoside phosphotransferase family enzyme/predicted kinase